MGFFHNLFGKKATLTDIHSSLEPSRTTGIGHDPELMDTLLGHHAKLGGLFEAIGSSAKRGDYRNVRDLLGRFKSSLQAHVLTENVRFYSYLERSLEGQPDESRTMHEFRREMNGIARQVVQFATTWQDSDFGTPLKREQFLQQYADIGARLETRFDNEEDSLYPLYRER